MESSYLVDVTADDVNQRIDKFLGDKINVLSRSRVKNLILSSNVLVSGKVIVDPDYRVKLSDRITVFIPEVKDTEIKPQFIPLSIIYEDQDIIVIDKPINLVVHPAPGNPENTLLNALIAHCGNNLSGIGGVKQPGIVHRLDKNTSGVIVIAKTDKAHLSLSEQFLKRSLIKKYLAVVWGIPYPSEGSIETNIGRSLYNRKKMAVLLNKGKHSLTYYKVIKTFKTIASLVECEPKSGRTHQIRVHMQFIRHPIIADPIYGSLPRILGEKRMKEIKDFIRANPRQALHAYKISFIHPTTKSLCSFKSNMPKDMRSLIALFEKF